MCIATDATAKVRPYEDKVLLSSSARTFLNDYDALTVEGYNTIENPESLSSPIFFRETEGIVCKKGLLSIE